MNNSILSLLPTLHATMLSIIIGFLTAYGLYVYQTSISTIEKIELLKSQVQDSSKPTFVGFINKNNFIIKDTKLLDLQQVKADLFVISTLFNDLDLEQMGIKTDKRPVEKKQIEDEGKKLLGLTGLIFSNYPYLTKNKSENEELEQENDLNEWIENISKLNHFLAYLWKNNRLGINELMRQFNNIELENRDMMIEKYLNEEIANRTKNGEHITEHDIKIIKDRYYYNNPPVDYTYHINYFFSRVIFLDENIIPQLVNNKLILEFYQNKCKIKKISLWILTISIFIFIFGIIIPIIFAYKTHPCIKSLEITLFAVTTAPYLFGLFYLMIIVSSLRQP